MRCPLVVLTGFLGAGKTTLVNRLLARRASGDGRAKLGVIVNELGAVGVDGALLGGERARQIELPGGCVCCVLGDELDRTLIELVDATPGIEAILLETTGAAEPIPIAWATEREPVASKVRTAAIVTLVDAVNLVTSRRVSSAVDAQIAHADVVLVTKAELATPAQLAGALEAISELAPRALVRRGSTDDHAAWLDTILRDPPHHGDHEDHEDHEDHPIGEAHVHTDACRHPDSVHGIDTVWIPVNQTVDLEELEDELASLPGNYVRIKGIVRAVDAREVGGTPRWFAVHRVGLRVSSEPLDHLDHVDQLTKPEDHEQARVVALGPAVRRDELADAVARSSR